MGDQDWSTVTFTKSAPKKAVGMSAQALAAGKQAGIVDTQRKMTGPQGLQKLEDETDKFKHAAINQELSKAITQARMAKKMTQKQLATAINEKPDVIQQYECGKAIPNPQIINKVGFFGLVSLTCC